MKPLEIIDDRLDAGEDGTELAPDDPESEKLLAMADLIVHRSRALSPDDIHSDWEGADEDIPEPEHGER